MADQPIITDAEKRILENAVQRLIEHFDTVQIFITKEDPINHKTAGRFAAAGNWFARYGQISEWVLREEAKMYEHEDDTEGV